jgi:hypothetical protein
MDSNNRTYSKDQVLFLGNGILRLPTRNAIPREYNNPDKQEHFKPSWSQYLNWLWDVAVTPGELVNGLCRDAFLKLTASRQAEWFDRVTGTGLLKEFQGFNLEERRIIRLHLLGCSVHSDEGVLTNDLIEYLIRSVIQNLYVDGSGPNQIDVITTNVDCVIEQNLAYFLKKRLDSNGTLDDAEIQVFSGTNPSATWVIEPQHHEKVIRLWKIHGCLRDAAIYLSEPGPETVTVARRNEVINYVNNHNKLPKTDNTKLCGNGLPAKFLFQSSWIEKTKRRFGHESVSGVFSISEYLKMTTQLLSTEPGYGTPAQELVRLFAEKSFTFIGFGLAEEETDIICLLQRFSNRSYRSARKMSWILKHKGNKIEEQTLKTRLHQLGIDLETFDSGALGSCPLPGKMSGWNRDNDWREKSNTKDFWRDEIKILTGQTWLDVQLNKLKELRFSPDTQTSPTRATSRKSANCIFAGLTSSWHSFVLKPSEFPSMRRSSQRVFTVDSDVLGGSALVPAMVCAVFAGPKMIGRTELYSTVPEFSSDSRPSVMWERVREFCLSAGVIAFPCKAKNSVARTSHVLLFPAPGGSNFPHQRFLLDADVSTEMENTTYSPAEDLQPPHVDLHNLGKLNGDSKSVLFIDKTVSRYSLNKLSCWPGLIVYETGTTGREIAQNNFPKITDIWTSGLCSFILCISDILHFDPKTQNSNKYFDGLYTTLFPKTHKLFWKPLFEYPDGGTVTQESEKEYSHHLFDNFHKLLQNTDVVKYLESVLRSNTGKHKGVVVTLHDVGACAFWKYENKWVCIKIKQTISDSDCIVIESEVEGRIDLITKISISDGKIDICYDGKAFTLVHNSKRFRRNTLGAGDVFRGTFAFGLSILLERNTATLADISRILNSSCLFAVLKCYVGSFVDTLKVIEELRDKPEFSNLFPIK